MWWVCKDLSCWKKCISDLCLSKCPKTCSHTSGLIGEINTCMFFDKNEESYQAVGEHRYGVESAASSCWDGALGRADAKYEGAGAEGKGLQAQQFFAAQHSQLSPAPEKTQALSKGCATGKLDVMSNRPWARLLLACGDSSNCWKFLHQYSWWPHLCCITKYPLVPNLCSTVCILTVTSLAPFHLIITLEARAQSLILCGSHQVPLSYAIFNFTGMVQMLLSRDIGHLKRSFVWEGPGWQVRCLHHYYLLFWQSMCHPHILPTVILCIIREH